MDLAGTEREEWDQNDKIIIKYLLDYMQLHKQTNNPLKITQISVLFTLSRNALSVPMSCVET